MPIHTVLGPIDPSQLGPTSMHWRILRQTRSTGPSQSMDSATCAGTWYPIASTSLSTTPTLQSPNCGVSAITGGSVVDVSSLGLHRRVADLPDVSERSGVNVLLGCGFYRGPTHPPWVAERSAEQLGEYIVDELENGLDGTGIKTALIGEVGTADPVSDEEWKVLQAVATAATETGAAISVHVDPQGGYQTHRILEWLTDHGADPARIILGHSDEVLDLDNHRGLMDAGATVEYDLFGTEFYYPGRGNYATDYERMEAVARLVAEGFADRLVLGCDVHMKAMLTAYGGMGYGHLMQRIAPGLREIFGVAQNDLDQILIENPARLLNRP